MVQKLPFRFDGPGVGGSFNANQLVVVLQLTGQGHFEPTLNLQTPPVTGGAGAGGVQYDSPTQISYSAPCVSPGFNPYTIPFDQTFLNAYVVVEPGGSVTATTSVTANTGQDPGAPCITSCTLASPDPILSASNNCSNGVQNLKVMFESQVLPLVNNTFTSSDHSEVPIYLNLKNNGSSYIVLQDMDIKLNIQDVYSTLPPITDPLDYFTESTLPVNTPVEESHNGNDHYFRFGSFELGGTIPPGGSIRVLAFTTLPPEGLNNILGRSIINVEYIRVYDIYHNCCEISSPGCTVDFPGILPCGSGFPKVTFSMAGVQSGSLGLDECQSAFEIVANVKDANNAPSSVAISGLKLKFETTTTGNLDIAGFTVPFFGPTLSYFAGVPFSCSPGPGTCLRQSGEFTYNGASVQLTDGMKFRVIYQGDNNTQLETLDMLEASVTKVMPSGACVPSVDEASTGTFLPQANHCTYCQNEVSIAAVPSNVPTSGCGAEFSVKLSKKPNSPNWKSFIVKLTLLNPDNLAISLTNINLAVSGLNGCPVSPPPGSFPTGSNYYVLGNTVYFSYCSPSPMGINLPAAFTLFNVYVNGTGCLDDVQFAMDTEVELADGMGFCHPQNMTTPLPYQLCTPCQFMNIGGTIQNEDGKAINIDVVPGGAGYVSAVEVTSPSGFCGGIAPANCPDGSYSLPPISSGECPDNFVVRPIKDLNPLNGVSTFDLVLISKHILGIQPLDSPYKIIAADANQSETVTTFDLVEIRKLILFIYDKFPDNSSWRFIDAAYVFPNPYNPFPVSPQQLPESIFMDFADPFNPKPPAANFIAIKVGDVNNSHATCQGFTGSQAEDRAAAPVELAYSMPGAQIRKGEEIVFDFYLNGEPDLAAWQAGLRFDPALLEFLFLLPSELDGMDPGNFGLTEIREGKLRCLWYDERAGAIPFKGEFPVFSARFKVKADVPDLGALFTLDESVLGSVAFEADGKASGLRTAYKPQEALPAATAMAAHFTVSTAPNPFRDELRLTVQLKKADYLDIAIFDQQGRMVATWNEYTEAGNREVVFDRTARWGTGLFTWQVSTGRKTLTGKVVKE